MQTQPQQQPYEGPKTITSAPQEYSAAQTKSGLEKLKAELSTPEKVGDLMKKFEKDQVDTSGWTEKPELAVDAIQKYFPEGEEKKILISALNSPAGSQSFELGKKTILAIADGLATRQKEISKAKTALSELNENSLNKNAKEGIRSVFNSVSRASTPEMIMFGVAALLVGNHIFKTDEKNTILKPLAIGVLGFFGLNSLAQHFTGKALTDRIHDAGVKFMPAAINQLPDQMQALAESAKITQPPELVALGKLGKQKMSIIHSYYNPNKKFIEPYALGFSENEISGEQLFKIVDTLVKKHDERKSTDGKSRVGHTGDFERDFVQKHDYTFLEASYLLYEREVTDVLAFNLSPEKRAEYNKKMENDNRIMFEGTDAHPALRDNVMSFYGIKFHTALAHSSKDRNPQYTYMIGDRTPITVRLDDSKEAHRDKAAELRACAKDFIQDYIKQKAPTSPALQGTLDYVPSQNVWRFSHVKLKDREYEVVVEEGSEHVPGKLIAKINGTPVDDWSKLESAV